MYVLQTWPKEIPNMKETTLEFYQSMKKVCHYMFKMLAMALNIKVKISPANSLSNVSFWGHWHPCFWFLVTSLGFKARDGCLICIVVVNIAYVSWDPPMVLHLLTSWRPAGRQLRSLQPILHSASMFFIQNVSKENFWFLQDPEYFNKYHHMGESNNLSNVRFLRYPGIPEGRYFFILTFAQWLAKDTNLLLSDMD